jgi:hypothetical protein
MSAEPETKTPPPWQLIETAPKDGTQLLVWAPDMGWYACAGQPIVAWNKGKGWYTSPGVYPLKPTHWMPLPDPPADGVGERAPRGA